VTVRIKFGIGLVLIILVWLALLFFYVPENWLRQVTGFATLTVDGRQVQTDIYLGNPTTNEAEAFLLVCIPGEGSFLFNFLDEDFRELSSREFVRLYRGAITLRPMSTGPWVQPLPSLNLNEFRVKSSNGHTVIISM
jgi:hypothetical protein